MESSQRRAVGAAGAGGGGWAGQNDADGVNVAGGGEDIAHGLEYFGNAGMGWDWGWLESADAIGAIDDGGADGLVANGHGENHFCLGMMLEHVFGGAI